jgi:predicted PurR-regulated permease PerM
MNRTLAHTLEIFSLIAVFSFCAFWVIPQVDKELHVFANEQTASVANMGASVTPNPNNTLAMQLRDWQESLDAKQAELQAREERIRSETTLALAHEQRILLGVIVFFLLALIITNTYTHHRDLLHEKYALSVARIDFHSPRMGRRRDSQIDLSQYKTR